MPTVPRYLTLAESADILRVNLRTVRRWIDEGRLPAYHVGRSVRIKLSDLQRIPERMEVTA